jgi:hypothetical protein
MSNFTPNGSNPSQSSVDDIYCGFSMTKISSHPWILARLTVYYYPPPRLSKLGCRIVTTDRRKGGESPRDLVIYGSCFLSFRLVT